LGKKSRYLASVVGLVVEQVGHRPPGRVIAGRASSIAIPNMFFQLRRSQNFHKIQYSGIGFISRATKARELRKNVLGAGGNGDLIPFYVFELELSGLASQTSEPSTIRNQ
jgi:hypothetical protein